MKIKFLFQLILLLCFTHVCSAQFKLGVKAGTQIQNVDAEQLVRLNGDSKSLILKNAGYGFHFGLVADIKLLGFYIRPEAILSTASSDFLLAEASQNEVVAEVFKESYQQLTIPVIAGIKLGPLRLGAGPVWQYHLDSKSDLFRISEYSQNFKATTFGYQALVGLEFSKIFIDLKYHGNLEKFGNHIQLEGQERNFDAPMTSIQASVGLYF